jgi:predicted nucleotidyltransferase
MNEPTVFDLISSASRETGARVILIGGFAVNSHGVARNTKDVDFLITDKDYGAIKEALVASGFEETVRTDVFAKQSLDGQDAMPVDFLFIDPNTFESMWNSGKTAMISGHEFKVASLMNLIALKLHAVKQGSKDRVWRDLPDIINLVISNRIDVASPDFVAICRKYGPAGIYEKILDLSRGGVDGRS